MELFFRKYFWTVNAAFLLLVAFLAARTVNLFVEAAIQPGVASLSLPSLSRPAALTAAPAQLSMDALARLTGLPMPKVDTPVVAPAFDPNAEAVKTTLNVKLLGTLVSPEARWSLASIQDLGSQRTGTYMVGDQILGADILEIERDRVTIRNNGRKEYISNEAGTGMPVPPTHMVGVREPGTLVTGDGIHAVSENNYMVPRSEVDKTLNNLNDVAMQARIVPAFKDGVAEGFKLFAIRPDSIYSKIGVENGDVIKRINGYDLNSPEKALEIYSKLKEASRIEIDIDRNGSNVHKTYNIQ